MPDLSPKALHGVAFGAPVPGQSWTSKPKNAKWEHPPQFTKLKDAMHFMMDQMTESFYMKKLLTMMDAGMPLEAIARTFLFAGFTEGKWTVDLAMLMYKPLLLSLIAIAHRAGKKNVPVVMPKSIVNSKQEGLHSFMLSNKMKTDKDQLNKMQDTKAPIATEPKPSVGFMQKKEI